MRRTFCFAGHDLTLPNSTYRLQCRICKRAAAKARHHKRKERAVAADTSPPHPDRTFELLALYDRLERCMTYERAEIRALIDTLTDKTPRNQLQPQGA